MASNQLTAKTLKAVDQNLLINQVRKMLDHFETFNFLNLKNSTPCKFGFHTENLKQILKNEWLVTNTVTCDNPVFLFNSLKNENDYKSAFKRANKFASAVPFNFVEIDYTYHNMETKNHIDSKGCPVEVIKNLFQNCGGMTLKYQTLCSPSNALETFHKQLRDRKIWWRKFSAWPERFISTEIVTDSNNNSQYIEIQAEFPWGCETVERILYLPEALMCKENFFEVKNKRSTFVPHIILSETVLEKIALTYICDAYEGINKVTDRDILRFNKKIAPYKVTFVASGHAKHSQNLRDLSLLLSKKIKNCGIPVLYLPQSACTNDVEAQFKENDSIGVPYTILLNENTLRDGILYIRSRDTTLKEDSHVSLVVSHVEKLFRSH